MIETNKIHKGCCIELMNNLCEICNTEYDDNECPNCKSNDRFEGMIVGDKQQ